jgi:hypothetical protein
MRVGDSFYKGQGIVIAALLLAAASCSPRSVEKQLVLPVSPLLSRDLIGYGVIVVSYTHVLDQPQRDAPSQGYVRKGSIVRVLERRLVQQDGKGISWVLIDGDYQGWLEEGNIQIYDNESRAKTASELFS